MKTCITCKEEKPFTKYHKNKNSVDGYGYVCKSCTSAYYKGYNASRKAANQQVVLQSKTCRDCGLEKPISQFGKKNNVPDKHNIYCKPCWRIRCSESMRRTRGKR